MYIYKAFIFKSSELYNIDINDMVYVTGFRYLFYLLKTVEGVLNTKSENKNRIPLKRDKAYS